MIAIIFTVFCEARGQIFTLSGGTCQERTCENLGQVICDSVASPGCDCPIGMVRELTHTKRVYFINSINLVAHFQIVADGGYSVKNNLTLSRHQFVGVLTTYYNY